MRWIGYVAYVGEMRNMYRFLVSKPEVNRWLYKNLGINCMVILKSLFRKIWLESVDWIRLLKDRDWCWVFVNMMINFCVCKRQGISWLAELFVVSSSEDEFCWQSVKSYLKEHTMHFCCKDQFINGVKEIITIYSVYHTLTVNTTYRQMQRFGILGMLTTGF
jgi:hypothetical protein